MDWNFESASLAIETKLFHNLRWYCKLKDKGKNLLKKKKKPQIFLHTEDKEEEPKNCRKRIELAKECKKIIQIKCKKSAGMSNEYKWSTEKDQKKQKKKL